MDERVQEVELTGSFSSSAQPCQLYFCGDFGPSSSGLPASDLASSCPTSEVSIAVSGVKVAEAVAVLSVDVVEV